MPTTKPTTKSPHSRQSICDQGVNFMIDQSWLALFAFVVCGVFLNMMPKQNGKDRMTMTTTIARQPLSSMK
jgi:hypothetical protein